MKTTKITDRNIIFAEPVDGIYNETCIGLILGKKNIFVIDTGFGSGSVAPVLEYIGNDTRQIIVINTHCHYDHIWGNWMFEKNLIISHPLCRELEDKHWDDAFRDFSDSVNGEVRKCLPNMVFEGNLCFPDDGVYIFHSPGHSADCISIYDSVEKILYAGDNIGDTDKHIVPYIDTDIETFQKLIEIYKKYDFNVCLSGHNINPQTKEVLTRMESALQEAWKKQNEER
jgi:glyoxylase-like metal-dependent hydrolase (beta-lactamase superfamily II)